MLETGFSDEQKVLYSFGLSVHLKYESCLTRSI